MKVIIDASIFTREAGSFGKVGGQLDKTVQPLPWFGGQLRVEDRILAANNVIDGVIVMLEDITVDSISQANALSEYLTKGFGLDVAPLTPRSSDQSRRRIPPT